MSLELEIEIRRLATLVEAHRIAQMWARREGRLINEQAHAARAAVLSLQAFDLVVRA
jgi:hypothetical protein